MKTRHIVFVLVTILSYEIVHMQKCQGNLCIENQACSTPENGKLSPLDGGNCLIDCSDVNKCLVKGTFHCITKLAGVTKNGNNECVCLASECFNSETNKCVTRGTDLVANSSTGICECSGLNKCFLPTTFNCVAISTGVFHSSSVNKECYCQDLTKCINSSNVCVSLSDSNPGSLILSYGNGKQCFSACNTSECWVSGINICHVPFSASNLGTINGSLECSCISNFCYNSSTKSCLSKVSSTTLSSSNSCICTDTSLCFLPGTNNCAAKPSGSTQTDGRECVCDDKLKCINSNSCITPTSSLVSNTDGKMCFAPSSGRYCSENSKCLDENSNTCKYPFLNIKVTSSGERCQCKLSTHCYSNSTCGVPSSGNLSYSDGLRCHTNCLNSNYCYDHELFYCKQKDTSSGITSTGSCVCSDSRKCYIVAPDTDKVKCHTPASGKISDKDGLKCQSSSCSTKTKCYHPLLFLCQPGNSNQTTGGVCVRNQLFEITNYIRTPFDSEVIKVKTVYSLEDNDLALPIKKSTKQILNVLRKDGSSPVYSNYLPSQNISYFNKFLVDMNMVSNTSGKHMVIYDFDTDCEEDKLVVGYSIQYFDCESKLQNFLDALNIRDSEGIWFNINGDKTSLESGGIDSIFDKLVGHDIGNCLP